MSIKTPITESGTLDIAGQSSFGSLLALGAVYHTAKYDKDRHATVMAVEDLDSLLTLQISADGAIDAIHDALQVLGVLIAYSKVDELGEGGQHSLGWLLAGLGELGRDLQNARSLIEDNMALRREEATR